VKNMMVTRIGLQVRFTNAETGVVFGASGLGEAVTTRELTFYLMQRSILSNLINLQYQSQPKRLLILLVPEFWIE
jgi:hypothetical protein